jgi:hypothetical protein
MFHLLDCLKRSSASENAGLRKPFKSLQACSRSRTHSSRVGLVPGFISRALISDQRERLTACSGPRAPLECRTLLRLDLDSFLGCTEQLSSTHRSRESRGPSGLCNWATA